MSKLVMITLLQTCMIAGLPRSPVEGAQEVPEADAKRFVEAGMAKYAGTDGDGDGDGENDGLDAKGVKELRALGKAEGAEFEGAANKAAVIKAIRDHRETVSAAKADLDAIEGDALKALATEGEVEVEEGADDAAIRAAILSKRFPVAA